MGGIELVRRAPRALAAALAGTLAGAALLLSATPAHATLFTSFASSSGPGALPEFSAGAAAVYPSTIAPNGLGRQIISLTVTVRAITHTFPTDLDVLLQGPQGQTVMLFSDVCGGGDVTNRNWTFSATAANSLPAGTPPDPPGCDQSATWQPTDPTPGDVLPAPAPAAPYGTLADFVGTDPNGTWNLFVVDDDGADAGTIDGWSLSIETPQVTFSSGAPAPGSPSPSEVPARGQTGPITDVNVRLDQVTHSFPDDLDLLLVSPQGTAVQLMSDACGSGDISGADLTFDDEAGSLLPDNAVCASGSYRPADYGAPPETYGGAPPAPPGGYPVTLSAFDGETPNGDWRLYSADDGNLDGGLIRGVTLTFTTAPSEIVLPDDAAATPSPSVRTVTAGGLPVTDVNVTLKGLSHTWGDDLDILLQAPNGSSTVLMSDACASSDFLLRTLTFDDESAGTLQDAGPCPGDVASVTPVDYDTGSAPLDVFGALAPADPGTASLGAFDGGDPAGDWKLWIMDDTNGDSGFIASGWSLDVQTRAGAPVGFAAGTATAAAGAPVALTLARPVVAPGLLSGAVRVRTTPGSATAGSDFTALDQVVEFAAGETSKAVQVPVAANAAGEPAESFTVTLSDPARDAALGATTSATVTVPASTPAPGVTPSSSFTASSAFALPSAKACLKRGAKLKLPFRRPKGVTVDRVEVLIGKTRVLRRTGAKARSTITLTKLPKRAFTLTVKVTPKGGKTKSIRRTYRICAAK